MIQKTQFNKISLDRIQEKFAVEFAQLTEEIKKWRLWVRSGQTKERFFYVSINADFEVDGILFYDGLEKVNNLYAHNEKAANELYQRAKKDGEGNELQGDPKSCGWIEKS